MSSYQGCVAVSAAAEYVFGFVSDPENLPQYVPGITHADLGTGDVVHIEGECPHGKYRGVGGFTIDAENLRMKWDSRANLNYRGCLQVIEREDHCEVSIFLEFDPGVDRDANQEFSHLLKHHPTRVQSAVDETLERIKNLCEVAVRKEERAGASLM